MPKRGKREGLCAYCGNIRRLTRDHVPPKSLFPKPRTSDLITVPCCEECRRGWSKDDEYFCSVIVNAASAYKVTEGLQLDSFGADTQSLMEHKMLDSYARPQAKGYLHKVVDEMIDLTVTTPEGIYLPHLSGFKPNDGSFNRVAGRIVRGLFFREKGSPVPKDYRVDVAAFQGGLDSGMDELREKLLEFPPTQKRAIQRGNFQYYFWQLADYKDATAWLAVFYRVPVNLIGFTGRHSQQTPLSHLSDN